MEIFIEIDKKKEQLAGMKLTAEAKRKLDKKFLLEWSFHSNHMEGNTLTYGETQLLLMEGRATGDHEKRDYDEMEAHAVAVRMVEQWAQDMSRTITEADIRQLNKIILVKPFWKDAITPEGQPTRKEIIPGTYKTSPNSVRLKNGGIHEYLTPEETPMKMAELTKRLQELDTLLQHPIISAASLHHQFVSIHPFDDGNGRVARLLTNYILIRKGYPPVVIKTQNKDEYLACLQKADVGDLEAFMHFLIKELHWSIDISIKAALGAPIDEPEDIDKRIEVLRKKLTQKDISTKPVSISSIGDVIQGSLFLIFERFESKVEKLKDLFIDYDRTFLFTANGVQQRVGDKTSNWTAMAMNWLGGDIFPNQKMIQMLEYRYQLKGFKKSVAQQYMSATIHVQFDEFTYSIRINEDYQKVRKYPYDSVLDREDVNSIVNVMMDSIINQISDAGGVKI